MTPKTQIARICSNCEYPYDPKDSNADNVHCGQACRDEADERYRASVDFPGPPERPTETVPTGSYL